MEKVEWGDVQGLVLSGYRELEYSAYVLWRFVPGQTASAKVWLRDLSSRLMRSGALDKDEEGPAGNLLTPPPTNIKSIKGRKAGEVSAINMALTVHGLDYLGVSVEERSHFSSEFLEGMAPQPGSQSDPRRCSLLGDVGESSPRFWNWGGWGANAEIDGVLLLYAGTAEALDALVAAETQTMQGAAAPIGAAPPLAPDALDLKGRVYCDLKEHFGFRDGISQPIIDGTAAADKLRRERPKEARISVVMPGEIVLGYPNERGAKVSFADRPSSSAAGAAAKHRPARDIGCNGTYLVFRQLEQNVHAFNDFIAQTAQRVLGKCDPLTEEWVASRLIGRLRNGEPLVEPAGDACRDADPRNDFLYHFEDRLGMACPIGAHIRRANPRDTIGPDPDTALRLSKMHRIIRRGRPYGERVMPGTEGKKQTAESKPRGMLFICLNADIAGQFEMIQHSWLNNAHFGGLYAGADPLSHYQSDGGVMTIQRRPNNLHIEGLKPFVTVRGGAYFFMPGIRALRSLLR